MKLLKLGNNLNLLITTIFFIVAIIGFLLINHARPKIMILHSYTTDYAWTKEINEGINWQIADKKSLIDIRYHYMDTKSATDAQKRSNAIIARYDIDNYHPDILIAIDDYANQLVAKHYVNHPDMNIIFAGINGNVTQYGYEGAENVTGIFERKPVKALVEILNIMNHYKNTDISLVFVSDNSSSAKLDADYIYKADWGNTEYIGHIAVKTFDEWKQLIMDLSADIDFILVGAYRKLILDSKDGIVRYATPEQVAQWTVANTGHGIIGLNSFNAQDGIPISVGVSPYEQGETVIKLAMNLINNNSKAGDYDFINPKQYIISINENARQDNHFSMPYIFEMFARATRHYYP